MKSESCQPNFALAIVVAVLVSVEAQELSLRLQVSAYSSTATDACVGGDVGLTDTSVSVQYRLASVPQGTTLSDWKVLSEIDPKIGYHETLDLPPITENSVKGVQFRLLQLEHGGGSCNCWRVEEARATWDEGENSTTLSHCFRMSTADDGSLFCGGIASRTRGFISETVHFNNGTIEPCPSDSNSTLISSKGSPLPQNCPLNSPSM